MTAALAFFFRFGAGWLKVRFMGLLKCYHAYGKRKPAGEKKEAIMKSILGFGVGREPTAESVPAAPAEGHPAGFVLVIFPE